MLRAVLASAVLLCLLLSLAVIALWGRSFWVWDIVVRAHDQSLGRSSVISKRGQITFERYCGRSPDHGPTHWTHLSGSANETWTEIPPLENVRFAGLQFLTRAGDGTRTRTVVLPYPALFWLSLLPGAWCLIALHNSRTTSRRARGLCERCGYDLRASPQRCPECGRAVIGYQARVRRSEWMLASVAPLMVGVMGWMVWWSNPARGARAGEGADPQHGIDFYPVWEPANGTGPNRMLHTDAAWGQAWYESLWRRPDGDLLVVVHQGPVWIHDFYDYWTVSVLDRSLHVIRSGQVGLGTDRTPYRLVEIRTDEKVAPSSVRGKWLLGVEWKWGRPATRLAGIDLPDVSDNWVEWADPPELPRELWETEKRTVRSAEPGSGP